MGDPLRKKQKLEVGTQSPHPLISVESERCHVADLPVDILLEVFVYLHPLDLVHLCRVSAGLRALLAQPSATFTWRESYKNVTSPFPIPPPCPPGQNIARYTAFLYCRTCNLCGAHLTDSRNTQHPSSMLTACYHPRCLKTEKFQEFEHRTWRDGTDPACALCSWFPHVPHAHGSQCMADEYEMISQDLSTSLSPQEEAEKIQKYREKQIQDSQHFKALHIFFHELQRTPVNYSVMIQAQGWERISGLVRQEGYEITKKLSLSKLIEWMGLKYSYPERMAPNLTFDQVWTSVRLKVIWEMERESLEILEQQLIDALSPRIEAFIVMLKKTLGASRNRDIEPTFMDFITNSPFQEVIQDVDNPKPVGDTTLESQLKSLMTHVPSFIHEWRKRSEEYLVNLISSEPHDNATHSLYLAKTFFKCHWCHEPLGFPRILAHKCIRTRYIAKDDEHHGENITPGDKEAVIRTISDRRLLLDFLWRNLPDWYEGARSWNTSGDQVSFHAQASSCATQVIEAIGKDPDTATAEFMDTQDARVECLTCTASAKVKTRKRLIMTWRAAIVHNQEKHSKEGLEMSVWGKVSAKDTKIAKEFESTNRMAALWSPVLYTCKHCNEDVPKKLLSMHLLDQHDIEWKEGKGNPRKRDFAVSIDHRMKRPPYVVRI